MIKPEFCFDQTANGYISDPITIVERALVHIELASQAPVVTLKQEEDGGYANYGMTPKLAAGYEINLSSKKEITVKLATPVEVKKCYIIN